MPARDALAVVPSCDESRCGSPCTGLPGEDSEWPATGLNQGLNENDKEHPRQVSLCIWVDPALESESLRFLFATAIAV